ncbi:hypothetical protein GPZ77_34530 (plasmid) [Streptomyces sp. QHH-9511]|uniref:hypothetical protein n=1 Tax=Streptomyces sp. QHH-9511 TaxID=2684468 RepID=UPI001319579D|nr:hypothetical protein [Streptomyces sp. QHH-9511]QGZ53349.1 hypothetical protein GPZ77_34530 [Streptomyces sp. QHH-9511]
MAADTAPAAVPDPTDRTQQAAQPGLLASMLAPVEPARPAAFHIEPATAEGAAPHDVAGTSSAAFHGDDNTPEKTQNSPGIPGRRKASYGPGC